MFFLDSKISGIVGPFGAITSVTLNSSGLISSITNPKSETYNMTYKLGTGLLETFVKPGGQVTTFTYNSSGKLVKDLARASGEREGYAT